MNNIVIDSIDDAHKLFRENELAYLSLTSKIELPFRDKWAYTLFKQLNGRYQVSRESKRTDLAILENQSPKVLIELKAMYSFDAALDQEGISGFTDAMSADVKKRRI